MNGTTRFLYGFIVTALICVGTAEAQVFRMEDTSNTGWQSTLINQAECANLGGFVRWPSHTTTWKLNTSGGGMGKGTAIQGALNAWTNVSNADFVLNWGGTTTSGFQQADGVNSMSWGTDGVCDTRTCHAITALLLSSGKQIQEADILFNANPTPAFQWMINGQSSANCHLTPGTVGLMLDTQAIATHELGHALGIHHPTNDATTQATMGAPAACTMEGRTLEDDDILALQCSENRYPESPTYNGALLSATCETIAGWAWNSSRTYQRSYVEIAQDLGGGNVPIRGIAHANQEEAPAPANGDYAFSIATPSEFKTGTWQTVRARYSGNQANIGSSLPLICQKELFPRSLNPSDPALSTGGTAYEVGTQFKSDVAGKITHLGYFFAGGENGAPSHTIKLWTDGGDPLASKSISPPPILGGIGWSYVPLDTAVAIDANTNYRVSVDTYLFQSKSTCGSAGSLQNPYVNSPLTALQGFWRTGVGSMPNISSCSNFFVSVTFDM